jgi:CLASP N terminal
MHGSQRKLNAASPRTQFSGDGPIQEFTKVIELTPTDQWTKRTNSFSSLVALIPKSVQQNAEDENWYSNSKTLRHLCLPISTLLKDSRSTVVKRTCENCTELFSKCGALARHLLKDLMPAILAVHAQTVQVIRTYVQTMVVESLVCVPCKSAMPIWLDKLKTEKSRTVREACAVYLLVALEHWELTRDIMVQVTNSLLRSLRDPCPLVREYIRQGLNLVRIFYPELWNALLSDPVVTKDMKLKRFLLKLGADAEQDDDMSSLASRGSIASATSNRSSSQRATSKGNRLRSASGLGPPLRVTTTTAPKSPPHQGLFAPVSPMKTPKNEPSESERVLELKRQASETRSRRSSLMKDRWMRSNSSILIPEDDEPTPKIKKEPEHMSIGRRLLAVHKNSIDSMMEMIRLEMDTMDDFESSEMTEDAVLTYFEALVICLEKRDQLAKELQAAMDVITQGNGET